MAEETPKQSPAVTDEVATIAKDIDIFAGWLKRLENPDPVLRTEAAGKGLKLYDEVDRDAHAGSVLQQRTLAVVGKEWEIIPARSGRKLGRPASTSQEQVVADFVSQTLENCNFDQARLELLKAVLYGYWAAEVLWQANKGDLRIRKIVGKHPRRFIFTPERELRLLTPVNMIDGEEVPDRKFIVFTCGDSDNPYGRGLGQRLWWPVWFKKNGIKFWLVFLEKFGMPTVAGKYPAGATPDQKKTLQAAVEAIQSDTGITFPDSMDVAFLEASRTGNVTHEQLCEFMDRQISKAVLGQTLTTEIRGDGSYAASQTHNEVRQEIIEADADLLDACLNDTLIPWIVDLNFPGVSAYPKIKTYAAPKPDLTAQVTIDKTLVVDIGLPVGTAYFYDTYGIPVPAEGEELVTPGQRDAASTVVERGQSPRFTETEGRFTSEQQAIEGMADIAVSKAADALEGNEEQIVAAVRSARSYNEAIQNVLELYPGMNTDDLAGLLEAAAFNADLYGRWTAGGEA